MLARPKPCEGAVTVEERMVRVETEVVGIDRRLGRLEDAVKEFRSEINGKMDRQFHWLVGLMFSALVAVVIALVRR